MLQSSSSEKIGKTSIKLLSCVQFAQKRSHYGPCPLWKTIFWGRNNKYRSSAFRNFLFYQNAICFGWVMNLFLSWLMFFVKKCHFQLKQLCHSISTFITVFYSLRVDIWFFNWSIWQSLFSILSVLFSISDRLDLPMLIALVAAISTFLTKSLSSSKTIKTTDCMFVSCHVSVSEWIYTL